MTKFPLLMYTVLHQSRQHCASFTWIDSTTDIIKAIESTSMGHFRVWSMSDRGRSAGPCLVTTTVMTYLMPCPLPHQVCWTPTRWSVWANPTAPPSRPPAPPKPRLQPGIDAGSRRPGLPVTSGRPRSSSPHCIPSGTSPLLCEWPWKRSSAMIFMEFIDRIKTFVVFIHIGGDTHYQSKNS